MAVLEDLGKSQVVAGKTNNSMFFSVHVSSSTHTATYFFL